MSHYSISSQKNVKQKKSKILLIDDEPLILEMYGIRLKKAGYKVFVAESAFDGYKIIKKENPDLVFVDIIMPRKDGFWLLKKIKSDSDKKISSIPIVMLTNLDDSLSRKKCCRLGCLYFLVKPKYTPSKLVEMVEDILK